MLRITVTNKHERKQLEHDDGPIEFGRGPQRDVTRCTIQDPFVSNDQLRLEPLSAGRVRLENLSRRNAVRLADGSSIAVGGSRDVELPVRLSVGETLIDIEPGVAAEIDRKALHTISEPVRRPGQPRPLATLVSAGGGPSPEQLTQWFETVVAVQRTAVSSPAFYQQTAQAVVELVGMDSGLVLLRRGDSWDIAARYPPATGRESDFSRNILRSMLQERRTFYQAIGTSNPARSLVDIEAVVSSPIFDAAGEQVVGAVYGSRCRQSGEQLEIRPLEAQVVQVLAAAVGAGLARMELEAEATRRHVQFEQFFSPFLARELDRDPSMLEGRDRDVTILFSDIRGFSRVSQQIGPRETCRLAGDVMERLTTRIREFEGVVVDYIGDGLLAMWNAPRDQPDHAVLACRAALAMMAELPQLDAEWRSVLGVPLRLGVGVNTGPALVGNTGSRQRFKYGPLGHTVNLASRVEGATKQLGVPVLITGTTQAQLPKSFATRRLCRVRVVGIAGAVDLYELHAETSTAEWEARRVSYEKSLEQFESGCWSDVPQAISALLGGHADQYDVPSLTLLRRAIDCINAPPEHFDPVWDMTTK
jgi:adenylate cyclase